MDEQRLEAYYKLIQELLKCPEGEENTILPANWELLYWELPIVMVQYAEGLKQRGDFLNGLAAQTTQALGIDTTDIELEISGNPEGYDEQELEAFFKLIQELLECPEGEENTVLQANWELLDRELSIIMMGQYAEDLKLQGDFLNALVETLTQDYQSLLMELLDAEAKRIEDGGSSELSIYPILQRNLGLLNMGLASTMQIWTAQAINAQPEATEYVAFLIHNLSTYFHEFPLGDRSINLEIGIVGYGITLSIVQRESNPTDWASTQNNLATAYRERIRGERAENIELAIETHKLALEVYTREAFPVEWAVTQNNLAMAYQDRIRGERAENIELAIETCNLALEVRTREAFPVEWAMTQHNLANAYQDRIRGERAENIELAIETCNLALEVRTREAFPVEWAMTQHNLANAYQDRIRGERAENIELAIETYNLALEVYTREAFPVEWAVTQHNLAMAYQERIRGERAENIELAIETYNLALEVYTREAFPVEWAMTQNNLAMAYQDRIRGERAENIELAIETYNLALEVYTREAFPVEWAVTQHNLAMAYQDRIRGERAENIELAIETYNLALEVYTREAFPVEWARTQHNLAMAYQDRIRGERAENIELAIETYNLALEVYTREAFPVEWAVTQHNLAMAYQKRIRGERAENIELAIETYNHALEVYTREAFPVEWARTQHNLANAYQKRIRGERAENIELAIETCNLALEVRTREAFPVEWAMTQHNLAMAYQKRIRGERAENIELAIETCNLALEVYTREAFPVEWAMTQHNLAMAYQDRIRGERADNIELAIETCNLALEVRTREAFPVDWAMTQHNLAMAYQKRIRGERADNIELAIETCNLALEVRTREAFPVDWAMTQHNLAMAYQKRIRGERAENIELAIAAYKSALEVYTPSTFPTECLGTGSSLGDLGFKEGNWQIAIEGYEPAINAVETSRTWATNDNRRQEILQEAIDIYDNTIQSYINLGQLDKAIATTERARSRHLVDLMASNDLYAGGNIPPEILAYLQQYDRLVERLDAIRQQQQFGNDMKLAGIKSLPTLDYETYTATAEDLLAEKDRVWQKIRALDPVLAEQIEVHPPDFAAMQQLVNSPTTALLDFYSNNDDTHIFIMRQDGTYLHTCTGQGIDELQAWIYRNWLLPYTEDFHHWREQIPDLLAEIARRLNLNEAIERHLQGIEELILVPHLYLHLIPFAALPIDTAAITAYLGDRFRIRYAPSCQGLKFCCDRAPVPHPITYGTVEDATGDLVWARFECEEIAKMLQIPDSQRLRGLQQANVENYRRLVQTQRVRVLHSSHHAKSVLDSPLDSHLSLAGGSITLGQLMAPSWRMPDLSEVFLSCCETGLGSPNITDDILTIAAGFLCAGARSVVSTLWSVEELSTALVCIFYCDCRRSGSDRPTAIQTAQQKLRTISSEEIRRDYGDRAIEQLRQERVQALANMKAAKTAGTATEEDSNRLKELTKEVDAADRRYQDAKHFLDVLYREDFPFASPFFWAAFICHGMA